MKKIIILALCIFVVGCKKEEKKNIAYVNEINKENKIVCISNNENLTNGYNIEESQEFIYDKNNKLKSVNIIIQMDLLNDEAKLKLNSVIDSYKNMSEIVNNNINDMYTGMNMNVYYTNDKFEVSIYYDINILNKENIDNIEFKKYINDDYIFDGNTYMSDQSQLGAKCDLYLQ